MLNMENTLTQTKKAIKDELEKGYPSASKILSKLRSLRIDEEGLEFDPKDEWRYLPATEFFDIVGETFKLNPEFYMKNLYKGVRKQLARDMNKRRKSRGISLRDLTAEIKESGFVVASKLREMEKYIFEKYCLYDGEQILLETGGAIRWGKAQSYGALYVTNHRIVCHGPIAAAGQTIVSTGLSPRYSIINYSRQQKCYGYIFPIKNLYNLRKKTRYISYRAKLHNSTISRKVSILMGKFPKREEQLTKIFEILSNHSKEEVRY